MKVFVSTEKDKQFFEECFEVEVIDMKNFDRAVKKYVKEECIICDKGYNFSMSAYGIKQLIEKFKDKSDVIYLSRWLDACYKEKEIGKFDDYSILTSTAHGSGVIYFSESAIEKLDYDIDMKYVYYMSTNQQFDCITTFPLVAYFNPNSALNNNEMIKCCMCREDKQKEKCCAQGSHSYGAFWFVIAFVIIICIILLMFNWLLCEDFSLCETGKCNIGGIEITY